MNGFGLPNVQEPDLANPHQLAPVAIPALNPREFTPTEQIDIAANLKRGLGPEYIANRSGPGGTKVSYIEGISVYQIYLEGWKSLAIANEVFGFNGCHLAFNTNTGWSSQVISSTIDYCDIINGKFNLGVSCIVRVSLKDGSFHEDVGTGSMDNSKSKSQAYDKSYKTAGLRALKNFGSVLGACLYDKEFIKKIKTVKVPNIPFSANELYRAPEFRKQNPTPARQQQPNNPPPLQHQPQAQAPLDQSITFNNSKIVHLGEDMFDDLFGQNSSELNLLDFENKDANIQQQNNPPTNILQQNSPEKANTNTKASASNQQFKKSAIQYNESGNQVKISPPNNPTSTIAKISPNNPASGNQFGKTATVPVGQFAKRSSLPATTKPPTKPTQTVTHKRDSGGGIVIVKGSSDVKPITHQPTPLVAKLISNQFQAPVVVREGGVERPITARGRMSGDGLQRLYSAGMPAGKREGEEISGDVKRNKVD